MLPLGADGRCPRCGDVNALNNQDHQLPVGTVLGGRYLIGRAIGQGGFGITYIGRDMKLGLKVAVKEFFPSGAVNRHTKHSLDLSSTDAEGDAILTEGRSKFLDEARMLALFAGDPNIVSVRDYFEENATAYIVMDFLDGVSLMTAINRNGPYAFDVLFPLLEPVMRSLSRIHQSGMIHRDISPSNLMLTKDGRVILLDFGTVRAVNEDGEKSLSVVLKPGFAPVEQYQSHGSQGPWTDVYALCASIYKLITGKTPLNSMNRLFNDELPLPSACGAKISPEQEAALMCGLSVRPETRFRSVEALLKALHGGAPSAAEKGGDETTSRGAAPASGPDAGKGAGSVYTPAPEPAPASEPAQKKKREKPARQPRKPSGKRRRWLIPVIIGAAALLAVLLITRFLPPDSHISQNSGLASYYNEEVTLRSLRAVKRHGKTTTLSMHHCTVSDEAIAFLAQIPTINSITLDDCSGFSSLNPLAGMSNLDHLAIDGYSQDEPSAFGASLITADFPQIRQLYCYALSFPDEGAFLSHFPNLQYLDISHCSGPMKLDGLSSPALRQVEISGVEIADFSPLSSFTALDTVTLDEMGVRDLHWAEPLSALQRLSLDGNELRDLGGLSGHTELYSLSARDNAITDISALSGCTSLQRLYLTGNPVSDLSVLAGTTQLETLFLEDALVSNLSPLSACTALETLALDRCPVADPAPLAACTAMVWLYMDETGISDLEFCRGMLYLKGLYASGNAIEDLSGLSDTTQLEELFLNGNAVTDLSPIRKNTEHLTSVSLRGNDIADFTPIAGSGELTMLVIDGNRASDLDFLSGCHKLAYLSAAANGIRDISGLRECIALQYTDLGENEIGDISPLALCAQDNQLLMLQNNRITDISALPVTVNYGLLALQGNPIADLAVLSAMRNASTFNSYLYLDWFETLDVGQLAAYPSYRIRLVDTPADRQAPLAGAYEQARRAGSYSYYGPPEDVSAGQAAADMESVREEARSREATGSYAIRINNIFS